MTQVIESPSEQAEAEAREALENEAAGFHDEVAAAREEEGLDAESALPVAADEGLFDAGTYTIEVSGKAPTARKVRIMGGAVEVEPPEGGWKKGRTYELRVVVRVSGFAEDDIADSQTDQVVGCTHTDKLKIRELSWFDKG
jgi:hypothetical protein